ncbi:6-carboxytetrahydropterin synthase [Marispirochaeta aestuarii]|uniref:6-pyruvoyl trahydropterin synthase family protein n=1 Tax=Marispirochaeta aestuarii TaxID=1963862 RepID=UPI0029C8AA6D|nr:6-carboxytetrahydropterin synthase [Marispirochaeta aestuarii]
MFLVGINGRFSAIHALAGDFGEETLPHSHPYRLDWSFEVRELDKNGFALNISSLQSARDALFRELDGKNLNTDSYFKDKQTSLENLCMYIAERLEALLDLEQADHERIDAMEIRVWESDDAWAGYRTSGFKG